MLAKNSKAALDAEVRQKLVAQLGFEPRPDEIQALIRDLKAHGIFDALGENNGTALAEALLTAARAEADPALCVDAYIRLIKAVREPLARRAVEDLETVFGKDVVVELVQVPPNSAQIAGRFSNSAFKKAASKFIADRLGKSSLYVGTNPRTPTFGGTRRGIDKDVAERCFVLLDFDREGGKNKDGTIRPPEPEEAWLARRADLIEKYAPLGPVQITNSGGGLHFVFRVAKTTDRDEMNRQGKTLNDCLVAIGSDKVGDLVRIRRVPFTINVPNEQKRTLKGRAIALAAPLPLKIAPKEWTVGELTKALYDLAPTDEQAVEPVRDADADADTNTTPVRPKLDRAPSPELADAALLSLPNEPGGPFDDRADWIKVGFAHRGAGGTRAAWAEWCARWGGSPEDDEKAWLSADGASGWRHLRDLVAEHAPEQLHKFRPTAAQAFDAAPLSDADTVALERAADSARTGGGGGLLSRFMGKLDGLGAIFGTDERKRAFVGLGGRMFLLNSKHQCIEMFTAGHRHGAPWPSEKQQKDITQYLEGKARTGGVRAELYIRRHVEPQAGQFLLDLANSGHEAVECNAAGWRIVPASTDTLRAERPSDLQPLPTPARDGNAANFVQRLRSFINMPPVGNPHDPDDVGVQAEAAVILFFAGSLASGGGLPILAIGGPNGSGKTVAARVLSRAIDPNSAQVLGGVKSGEDLNVAARGRHVFVLDNLSRINDDFSDALCRLSTGTGAQNRKLHTDEDVHSLTVKRPVILTSIVGDLVEKEDLSERTFRLNLDRPVARRTEADLWAAWEREHPALLASLLDAMAEGFCRLPAIKAKLPGPLPRLADAGQIAGAVAQGLAWPDGLLLNTLARAQAQVSGDQLDLHPIGARLDVLLALNPNGWEGSAEDLGKELARISGPAWPGPGARGQVPPPRKIRADLERIVAAARDARGWIITFGIRAATADRKRLIRIEGKSTLPPKVAQERARDL